MGLDATLAGARCQTSSCQRGIHLYDHTQRLSEQYLTHRVVLFRLNGTKIFGYV